MQKEGDYKDEVVRIKETKRWESSGSILEIEDSQA